MVQSAAALTSEQLAAIDWEDPRDVLGHHFTVTQMAVHHPRLLAMLDGNEAVKRASIDLFLTSQVNDDEGADAAMHQDKIQLLERWAQQQLFTLRTSRFCRACRQDGHTKTYCKNVNRTKSQINVGDDEASVAGGQGDVALTKPALTCKQKFQLHMQSLERQKLLQEKLKTSEKRNAASGASGPNNSSKQSTGEAHRQGGGGPRGGTGRPQRNDEPAAFATEERRRGVVIRCEHDRGVGFVNVHDCGEVRFFLDRTDYGIKEPNVGDAVTLKLDLGRDMPTAVEVRPENVTLTPKDVLLFLEKCSSSTTPIKLLETLLMQRHEWPFVVATIAQFDTYTAQASSWGTGNALHSSDGGGVGYVASLNVLVATTTFVGNREPVHLVLLRHFLKLMATPCPIGDAAPQAVFPDLLGAVVAAVPSSAAMVDLHLDDVAHCVDGLVELANLVLLYRQLTDLDEADIARLSTPLEAALSSLYQRADVDTTLVSAAGDEGSEDRHRSPSARIVKKRVALALAKLAASATSLQASRTALFPSADELSIPPFLVASPFHPSQLPVNVTTKYSSSEDLIAAQSKLLRADTFESTCRALAVTCYTMPDVVYPDDVLKEAEHVRLLHRVSFCGRVPTRDRDFSSVNSYLFHCETRPGSKKVSLAWQFQTGSCVCFTTGLDRARIEAGEVFWGIITSADTLLLSAGIIVVAPCDGSDFHRLTANLKRNAIADRQECSMVLEVPMFLAGYQGVVSALLAFMGPAAMPLPMSNIIVQEEAPPPTTRQSPPVGYVPPHARFAFDRLVEDVRGAYHLDPGQDEAMCKLSTNDLLLIQGPPGTGKSFIGARIVEVYIRFKQLMASGDILNTIDVDALPSTKWDKLAPKMGPVVVITYKNHALDEFLLDLMRSGLWKEERQRVVQTGSGGAKSDLFPRGRRIVRVGGRSREAMLADYNLNTLVHARGDKAAVNSFRERIYLMNSRLERLAKEIHLLEKGKVPRSYFEKWLTAEQRNSIRFEEKETWLAGENYTGRAPEVPVDPLHYLTLIQSDTTPRLAQAAQEAQHSAAEAAEKQQQQPQSVAQDDDEDDIQLSVFQEMRRENDSNRETNNNLRNIYLSAESLALAEVAPAKPDDVPETLMSLWSLSPILRHKYYAFLIQTAIAIKARDCVRIMDAMQNMIVLRNHAIERTKLELLQGADVIGFTTTGCAMNQSLLRSLRPSVLVVEEAAEVLEAQLLACMTDSLKQIVLIGDHYQLKPKVDTFMYEKINHLNVSMFERLANRVKPIRLVEQRRMHPDISALVRPFYDGQPIQDHRSVLDRPFVDASGHRHFHRIPGLGTTRLFLWEHSHPEETAPHSLSKINRLELSMCVHLVEHLITEGVHPKSVTVITPYLGQCRALRNALRLRPSNQQLRDVHVSTVDLYQGDENDIVILSMVRTKVLTEFLRMRNRMIVACSRARFAMIIVGNGALMQQSPHWAEVLQMLRDRGATGIGTSIPLEFNGQPKLVKNNEWPRKRSEPSQASVPATATTSNDAMVQGDEAWATGEDDGEVV